MRYLTYAPAAPLAPFVHLFWYYEGYSQPHAKERVMPDGSVQIVINLLDDRLCVYRPENPEEFDSFNGAIFVGPRSGFTVIDTASQRCMMGVQFRPGGASRFVRMPLSEARDQIVSVDELWRREGLYLREGMLETTTPEAKFLLLERWLRERMISAPFERCVDGGLQLITRNPTLAVAKIAASIGASERRFVQSFSADVGLTPKLFCRIQRFQRVLKRVALRNDIDWTEVALDSGYFDQAHFNHDFRAFSGMSPTSYLRRRTAHLNHVPLVD